MEMEDESNANPNWLELPKDITMNILQRLDTLEIVTSACVVCPLWWKICKDPLMWRTIDMLSNISLPYSDNAYSYHFSRLEKVCHYAVHRSCGDLKDISIKKFATNGLLHHIANSASTLRCIRLDDCYKVSDKVFCKVVKKQPFLEEIDIAHCFDIGTGFFEYIGQCCPALKVLKLSFCKERGNKCDDVAFAIAKTMLELRHLKILNNELTNDGLLSILDGCHLLESLDLRGCLHLDLDGSLGRRCKETIKELRLPMESIDHIHCYDTLNSEIYDMQQFELMDFDQILSIASMIAEIPD